MAARNFTKNAPRFPRGTKHNQGTKKTVPLVNHTFLRRTPAIFVVSRGLSSKALVLLVRIQGKVTSKILSEPQEGPLQGPFFQFWGAFFLHEDWVAQMHSGTLLSSTTLHAQSRKLAQMCLRKCSDPNPGTQVCPNFKRLLLQQVHGASATLSSVCQNFFKGLSC